jgi:hypothetical protein
MQVVKFEDLPYTSRVQCHLKYPIITARTAYTGYVPMIAPPKATSSLLRSPI